MNESGESHAGARYTSFEAYEKAIDDTEAARIFVDVLQRNPEVCSNCFLKIRDVYFPHDFALDKRGEHTWTWKGLVRYYISKPDRVETAAVEGSGNPPNACANCGSIRGSTNRPLPKDRAVEYAWNLSSTLSNLDVEHNPLLLAFVVAFLKQFPEFGSRDDDNFRTAVEYAIADTDLGFRELLTNGPANPAWTDDDPLVERTALPRGRDDDRRPRAFHGRPALFRRRDE